MSPIQSNKATYFDLSAPTEYWHDPRMPVHDGDIFLTGLDRHAIGDVQVAIKVLRAIKQGRINIFCQERVLDWLQHYFVLVSKRTSPELTDAYFEAMDAIVARVDTWFKYRGYSAILETAEGSEYFGFGAESELISWMLQSVRFIATREAYRHWAVTYGRLHNPHTVERPGSLRLLVDSPRDIKFSTYLEGDYLGGAAIKRITDEDKWEIIFDDYFPQFQDNSLMWTRMFKKIAPMMEQILEANVSYQVKWLYED